MRALTPDPHRLRGVDCRPPLPADPVHQESTAMNSQTGVSAGHGNLRAVCDVDKPHLNRGFSLPSTLT
jgi:hypothetical protein